MKTTRRNLLAGASGLGAVSVAEWLGFFRHHGVPGTPKDWGIAKARAAEEEQDRFLLYWNLEGGWDAYSMLSPVHTPNHSSLSIPENTLTPTPSWSSQTYRVANYGSSPYGIPQTVRGIEHGYLATDGQSLFPDMCVVSSVRGNQFHSGGRWDLHYGTYPHSLGAQRQPDERTVMQAFAEAKGANFLLPHISWHRWLADGELDFGLFPEGTGYYEKLGPAYAHTVYGRTPADLRARLIGTGDVATQLRRRIVRSYTDDLRANFVNGRNGQSVQAFASALDIHHQLADNAGNFDVENLFTDAALKEQFGVLAADEFPTSTVVNGNPARSKESPHIRVQAMMAFELMRAKISCAMFLESRDVRRFDSHRNRRGVFHFHTNSDQIALMREELWNPLTVLVNKLKTTEMPGAPGSSMWSRTNIVLCSEMGRTIQGDVEAILSGVGTTEEKYQKILDQDVCQHSHVSSAAFLGTNVAGGQQFGRVGNATLDHIPMLQNGVLDPAFNATTGNLNPGQSQSSQSFIADSGNIYATALDLGGVSPTGKGRNTKPAMPFVKKTA